MKILKIEKGVCYYVETDAPRCPQFRRSEGGYWERCYGASSWEECGPEEEQELEGAFATMIQEETTEEQLFNCEINRDMLDTQNQRLSDENVRLNKEVAELKAERAAVKRGLAIVSRNPWRRMLFLFTGRFR